MTRVPLLTDEKQRKSYLFIHALTKLLHASTWAGASVMVTITWLIQRIKQNSSTTKRCRCVNISTSIFISVFLTTPWGCAYRTFDVNISFSDKAIVTCTLKPPYNLYVMFVMTIIIHLSHTMQYFAGLVETNST